jgi:hypothetical protein
MRVAEIAFACTVALEVEDFDAAIAQLKANSVRFRVEPPDAGVP